MCGKAEVIEKVTPRILILFARGNGTFGSITSLKAEAKAEASLAIFSS